MIYFLVGYLLGKRDNEETTEETTEEPNEEGIETTAESVRLLLECLSIRSFRQEKEESRGEYDAPTIQKGPGNILEGCSKRFSFTP